MKHENQINCPNCKGEGYEIDAFKDKIKCYFCKGKQKVPESTLYYDGIDKKPCTFCNGTGKRNQNVCFYCQGKGYRYIYQPSSFSIILMFIGLLSILGAVFLIIKFIIHIIK